MIAQPAPMRREVGQDRADQLPECPLVVADAQVAELVHHDIFEHRLGRQDQTPVEIDHAAARAAAPEALLRLDPDRARHETVRRPVALDEALGIEARLVPQPLAERRLDHCLALALREALGQPDLEAVPIADRRPGAGRGSDLQLDRTAAIGDPAAVREPQLSRMRLQRPAQSADPVQHPAAMLLDEGEDLELARARRRHHLDAVRRDREAKPPRAGAPSQAPGDGGRADQQRAQVSSRNLFSKLTAGSIASRKRAPALPFPEPRNRGRAACAS